MLPLPRLPALLVSAALAIAWQQAAAAEHATSEDSNKSNNPLNPAPGLNGVPKFTIFSGLNLTLGK